MLFERLRNGSYDLDSLNTLLYDIPKAVYPQLADSKELRNIQSAFFKTVYRLLLGKEQGPRLYLFLAAIDPARYLGQLDFSYPETEEEKNADKPVGEPTAEEAPKAAEIREPDPMEPVKPQVTIDDFAKLDFRVCKVLKAETVRKSNACLKLTLFDGIGERVIMSSIKAEYKPEDLIGKKIIVIANLKPSRICNVNSQGMLLAATNNACGCKVLFVDDAVPEGTPIH